jgi:hypothetical protein
MCHLCRARHDPNRRGAALENCRHRMRKRSIAYLAERRVRPRLPIGVATVVVCFHPNVFNIVCIPGVASIRT